ncbi:MAG: right-handed parallel beta-helix repeat-containing protein [Lachnospiraceae bacterium]|nr:right-handed parallel beta-helix repeat-containing protein [Lachnospiraceae bacterium]
MKRKNLILAAAFVLLVAGTFFTGSKQVEAAKAKTYTISPNKIPAEVKKSSAYNSNTKNWLQLQYYLKKLQSGGGKLVLKKGTYKISNTLYVPSNTTIELKAGATLKKINKAKGKIKPAKNMFVLVSYNKKDKKNASSKYNGPKNIKFIGHGETSVIDLGYIEGAHGISASHNQNLTFENITFKGENGGHYIELAGAKNVVIKNNRFLAAKDSTRSKLYNKEAINIDTADSNTGGFTLSWSKKDQTPNVNISIYNNTFDGVNRAIGTHKYSQKKDAKGKYSASSKNVYHQNITIRSNTFKNVYDNAIFIMNWKDTTIDSNQFTKLGLNNKRSTNTARHAIAGGGVTGMTITNNNFSQVAGSVVYFRRTSNNGGGSQYYPVLVYVTESELEKMVNNTVADCERDPSYYSYDILMFKGDADRTLEGAYGMDLLTKEILSGVR